MEREEGEVNKEKIYDEKVAPLMKEVIAICKEHNIAWVASFAIPNDEDPDLICTTALLTKENKPYPDEYRQFYDALYGRNVSFAAITVTRK